MTEFAPCPHHGYPPWGVSRRPRRRCTTQATLPLAAHGPRSAVTTLQDCNVPVLTHAASAGRFARRRHHGDSAHGTEPSRERRPAAGPTARLEEQAGVGQPRGHGVTAPHRPHAPDGIPDP